MNVLRPLAAALAVAGCAPEAAAPAPRPTEVPVPSEPPVCTLQVMAGVPGANGSGADGLAATATFLSQPQDVTPGANGEFWIGDYNNHRIRYVDPAGISRVVVGSGFPGGGEGGPALTENLDHPTMAVPDPERADVLWFAATGNHRIGRVEAGTVTFPYGTGAPAFAGDGSSTGISFYRPSSLAFSDDGTLYVSDRMNQVVRAIDRDGVASTVVGTPGVSGYSGDGGLAVEATLSAPAYSETDPGNRLALRGDRLVLADTGNHVIREVDLTTGVIVTLAGDGTAGWVDGPAEEARFDQPRDVAIASDGTVYVADAGNAVVRAIADGQVRTVVAVPWPAGVAVGPDDALWIADRTDSVIYRMCP